MNTVEIKLYLTSKASSFDFAYEVQRALLHASKQITAAQYGSGEVEALDLRNLYDSNGKLIGTITYNVE